MEKGNFSGTSASAALLAADESRGQVLIQKTNATVVALGIGEDAVAGEGIQLGPIGDSVVIRGYAATLAINVIGNNGAGTYQTGDVTFAPGPHIAS